MADNSNFDKRDTFTLDGTEVLPLWKGSNNNSSKEGKTTIAAIKEYNLPSTGVTVVNGVQSSLLIEPGIDGNDGTTYTAKAYGVAGDSITITHLGGQSKSLSVTVTGTAIVVQLATNGSSVVTTTAAGVKTAIEANAAAAALVTVAYQGTGAGLAGVKTVTPLAGGVDVTAGDIGSIRFKADGSLGYIKTAAQVWKKFTLADL